MPTEQERQYVRDAVVALADGGVIAYPTEHCFGLGCDPRNTQAIERLLEIKQRARSQGVILIAADLEQVALYGDLSRVPNVEAVTDSWPGANTWLLPAKPTVSDWVCGQHTSIAIRIPGLPLARALCREFAHPIVSTSANRHGEPALLNYADVVEELGAELDYIVDAPVAGASRPSVIRDALSGQLLR